MIILFDGSFNVIQHYTHSTSSIMYPMGHYWKIWWAIQFTLPHTNAMYDIVAAWCIFFFVIVYTEICCAVKLKKCKTFTTHSHSKIPFPEYSTIFTGDARHSITSGQSWSRSTWTSSTRSSNKHLQSNAKSLECMQHKNSFGSDHHHSENKRGNSVRRI